MDGGDGPLFLLLCRDMNIMRHGVAMPIFLPERFSAAQTCTRGPGPRAQDRQDSSGRGKCGHSLPPCQTAGDSPRSSSRPDNPVSYLFE